MASHWTCPLFLKVLLVCLPYTVTGNANNKSILVERSFSPVRRSAWVAPRMICARQSGRRSPPMPTWDSSYAMSPVGYDDRGDGNGTAGNQASVLYQFVEFLLLRASCSQEEEYTRIIREYVLVLKTKARYIPGTPHQARPKKSACAWIREQDRRSSQMVWSDKSRGVGHGSCTGIISCCTCLSDFEQILQTSGSPSSCIGIPVQNTKRKIGSNCPFGIRNAPAEKLHAPRQRFL